jgi:hypothetical protein
MRGIKTFGDSSSRPRPCSGVVGGLEKSWLFVEIKRRHRLDGQLGLGNNVAARVVVLFSPPVVDRSILLIFRRGGRND